MSYLLPHLHSGFAVDQAILAVRCESWELRGMAGSALGEPEAPCLCSLASGAPACRRRTAWW